MLKDLRCHDDTPCPAVHALQVEAERRRDDLLLHYRLAGDLSLIRIPLSKPAAATDGLWQHTCFELFIGQSGTSAYYEFNFSPSGQWAAYAFSAYRERIPWTILEPPVVAFSRSDHELLLTARIANNGLPFANDSQPWQLGLSAVVESVSGELSYWALRHPSQHPDFHDRSGFVCLLSTC